MLQIVVPGGEEFDDNTQTFSAYGPETLYLEHSLIAVSKWEAKWHKAYYGDERKTDEQFRYYIKCMAVNDRQVDQGVYNRLTVKNLIDIDNYIADPMTATHIHRYVTSKRLNNEVVTSEMIYYYMTIYGIPFECEKWNINRLITLIDVCEARTNPQKKLDKKELNKQNAALNAARKAKLHTHG